MRKVLFRAKSVLTNGWIEGYGVKEVVETVEAVESTEAVEETPVVEEETTKEEN